MLQKPLWKNDKMPIVWKVLLRSYSKIFLQCLLILFTLKFVLACKTIAKALSHGYHSFKLVVYYLNYFSETAHWTIGICSAIAAFSTYYKLTANGGLATLRSLGISLYSITKPITLFGFVLSIFTFITISELVPYFYTKQLEFTYKVAISNPLLIMQEKSLPQLQESYMKLNLNNLGNKAINPIIIQNSQSTKRLTLYHATEFSSAKKGAFTAKDLSLISHLPSKITPDHTFIQNYSSISLNTEQLTPIYRPTYTDPYYFKNLPLKPLLKIWSPESLKIIVKRISYALFPFTLTILSISLARVQLFQTAQKHLLFLLLIFLVSATSLICAKNESFALATLFLFLPHILATGYVITRHFKTEKGLIS